MTTPLIDVTALAQSLEEGVTRLMDARAAASAAAPLRVVDARFSLADPQSGAQLYARAICPARCTPISTGICPIWAAPAMAVTHCRTARRSPHAWASGASGPIPGWWSMTPAMAAWPPRACGGCCG